MAELFSNNFVVWDATGTTNTVDSLKKQLSQSSHINSKRFKDVYDTAVTYSGIFLSLSMSLTDFHYQAETHSDNSYSWVFEREMTAFFNHRSLFLCCVVAVAVTEVKNDTVRYVRVNWRLSVCRVNILLFLCCIIFHCIFNCFQSQWHAFRELIL